jgi:large subunit ribosomal protein L4
MTKITVYNLKGEKRSQAELPKEIFDVKLQNGLLHQAVVTQMSNSRKVLAHTKDRSEVRGGGRKPWQQKGTGRARHGSIRSPIWIGGGVTFGPTKERNFSKKINKKMKRKALFMALSSKVKDDQLVILDKIELAQTKTKNFVNIISNLSKSLNKDLLKSVQRAASNLPKIKVVMAKSLNIVDVLKYRYLIIYQDAVKIISEHFIK